MLFHAWLFQRPAPGTGGGSVLVLHFNTTNIGLFFPLMRRDSGRQEGQERRFVLCSCFVSRAEERDTQGSLARLFTLTMLQNGSAGQERFAAFCTLARGFATRQWRGYIENQLLFGGFSLLSLQIK